MICLKMAAKTKIAGTGAVKMMTHPHLDRNRGGENDGRGNSGS